MDVEIEEEEDVAIEGTEVGIDQGEVQVAIEGTEVVIDQEAVQVGVVKDVDVVVRDHKLEELQEIKMFEKRYHCL